MTWLTSIVLCAIGMLVLEGEKKLIESEDTTNKKEPEKYSYEYCREKLKVAYYTDWNCQDISKQLKDAWVRDDIERLMRYGYSFEYAVDTLIEDGIIKIREDVTKCQLQD